MRRSIAILAAVTAAVSACSSSGGGGGPKNGVTGTINGQPVIVKSALIVPTETIGNSTLAVVVLSDKPDICAQAKLGNFTPSSTWFEIELAVASSTGGSFSAATDPGAYVIGAASGNYALSALYKFDASCAAPAPTLASGGSADVITFDATGASGTANLTFGADHVTATFDVESCPELTTISICQ